MSVDPEMTTERYWDGRYREQERMWSGRPNDELVRQVGGMAPGTVLDLGCGEGGDALWLAAQGWRVTAVDVSAVALARGAERAATAGVGDRIAWQRHDLARTFPDGTFDLVASSFLYSPGFPRTDVLRRAAGAVAPGGTFLVIGHADDPVDRGHDHAPDAAHGAGAGHHGIELPTPDELLADLVLPADEWVVEASAEHPRTQALPDGTTLHRTDNTLRLRRVGRPA